MTSNSPNNLLDNLREQSLGYPLRDNLGRFFDQHKLKVIRVRDGRRKRNLCNCCKTNTIPKGKYYCDFCKEFIQVINCKYKERIYRSEHKAKRFKRIFGSNPGNVLQMINSFKKYKSSSYHYKGKYEEALAEVNRLKLLNGMPIGQKV